MTSSRVLLLGRKGGHLHQATFRSTRFQSSPSLLTIPRSKILSRSALSTTAAVVASCSYATWKVSNSGILNNYTAIAEEPSRVLACSSSELLELELEEDDGSTLQHLRQWLEGVLTTCWDVLLVALRSTEIALHLSPLLVLTPASIAASQLFDATLLSDIAWWYTTRTMQTLGPSFVKLCQWIATRRDVFPPHICNRLGVLHDRGMVHAWSHTHTVLCEAFGDDYRERGLDIRPHDVVGSGSAAQVYKGILTEQDADGTPVVRVVAIKVLHPQFREHVTRDLWLLETVAKLLHALPFERIRMINFPRATQNFASILHRQADLRIEADNLRQFRANFYATEHDEERSQIVFPKPMEGWITEKVLVENLLNKAVPIASYMQDASPHGMAVRKELGGPLCRAFFKMVFLDNFGASNPTFDRAVEKNESSNKIVVLTLYISFYKFTATCILETFRYWNSRSEGPKTQGWIARLSFWTPVLRSHSGRTTRKTSKIYFARFYSTMGIKLDD
jgi:hypothetical protein